MVAEPTRPYQIKTLDLLFLGRPTAIASFLILAPGGPVLIETGPGSTLPRLISALAAHGVKPGDVRDVLVTHIHLDHAGAAGWWATHGARVHVHQRGAPHLIDPARLLASARRIYAHQMGALWGELLPAPAQNVRALHDAQVIEAGGLKFTAHDTPGHANHHMAYALDDIAFVGDLAGIRVPGHAHLRLPTPPPEFDAESWLTSVRTMAGLNFRRIFLTHFGPVEDVAAHWQRVGALLPEYTERVRTGLLANSDRADILAGFEAWEAGRLRADGVQSSDWPLYSSLGPGGMSVDGLLRYWQKRGTA